jgi:hypothetical protein|tara:strand:+ start:7644 stop:7952 length:309 start_codon:yes stop_codon:yes gene_type:complete
MSDGDKSNKPLTPNMIANIMFAAAKGDDKLPPLRQVCNDFGATITLACRDMFMHKVKEGDMPSKDIKDMEKIVIQIDKRFQLSKAVLRSPAPSLHRLLKEEN